MRISLRICCNRYPEVTVEVFGASITDEVGDLKGYTDQNFIDELRDLADDLERNNERLKERDE